MARSQQKMGGKRWFCGWYKEVGGHSTRPVQTD